MHSKVFLANQRKDPLWASVVYQSESLTCRIERLLLNVVTPCNGRTACLAPKTYWQCGSAPWCWRRGRPPQSAAGAWPRTVIWVKRRSIWRDGSAEWSPARCRLQRAQTSAGPDSSSHGRLQPGSYRGRGLIREEAKQDTWWITSSKLYGNQGHSNLLYVFFLWSVKLQIVWRFRAHFPRTQVPGRSVQSNYHLSIIRIACKFR